MSVDGGGAEVIGRGSWRREWPQPDITGHTSCWSKVDLFDLMDLAKQSRRVGYNEEAQVLAAAKSLPRDLRVPKTFSELMT
jgi:hypothetical protein